MLGMLEGVLKSQATPGFQVGWEPSVVTLGGTQEPLPEASGHHMGHWGSNSDQLLARQGPYLLHYHSDPPSYRN